MSCYRCGAECDGVECANCSAEGLLFYSFDTKIDFTRVKTLPELLELLNAIQIVVNTEQLAEERLKVIRPYLVKL